MIKRQLRFKRLFAIFTHTLSWALHSPGNNFQLKTRLGFFNSSYVKFMQFEKGLLASCKRGLTFIIHDSMSYICVHAVSAHGRSRMIMAQTHHPV